MDPLLPKNTVKRWRCLLQATASILITLFTAQPVLALEPVSDFGPDPGNLLMFLHRPSGHEEGLPLVVALHGCTQTAADFDDETGLVALAEEIPFLLLLPEQREGNMSRRCFRWYDQSDNRPGLGESASILEMIDFVIKTEGVDPDRVFVLGLSAGGAMTSVLMANYPSRFAGGAIFGGLPFDCNRPTGTFDAFWNLLHFSPFPLDGADASFACGIAGYSLTDRDAVEWAGYITETASMVPERWPLVSLWQGTGDATVDPDNLRELTEQWTAIQGIDAVADAEQTVGSAVREVYRDEAGNPRVETWSIENFGHAIPIDADGDPDVCGLETEVSSNANLCAIRRVADFWHLQ
jgi:poly(3-hydroxybutyrate) depolymerase